MGFWRGTPFRPLTPLPDLRKSRPSTERPQSLNLPAPTSASIPENSSNPGHQLEDLLLGGSAGHLC